MFEPYINEGLALGQLQIVNALDLERVMEKAAKWDAVQCLIPTECTCSSGHTAWSRIDPQCQHCNILKPILDRLQDAKGAENG